MARASHGLPLKVEPAAVHKRWRERESSKEPSRSPPRADYGPVILLRRCRKNAAEPAPLAARVMPIRCVCTRASSFSLARFPPNLPLVLALSWPPTVALLYITHLLTRPVSLLDDIVHRAIVGGDREAKWKERTPACFQLSTCRDVIDRSTIVSIILYFPWEAFILLFFSKGRRKREFFVGKMVWRFRFKKFRSTRDATVTTRYGLLLSLELSIPSSNQSDGHTRLEVLVPNTVWRVTRVTLFSIRI